MTRPPNYGAHGASLQRVIRKDGSLLLYGHLFRPDEEDARALEARRVDLWPDWGEPNGEGYDWRGLGMTLTVEDPSLPRMWRRTDARHLAR
jgi:hypothetical protein